MAADHHVSIGNPAVAADVTRTVRQTELLLEWVPRALILFFWLLPVVAGLGGGIGNAVVAGIVMGLVTPLVIRAVHMLLLEPMRLLRYRRAAQQLDSLLFLSGPALLMGRSWHDPKPGVLAVTLDGDLVLADATTGYTLERMPAAAIRDVTVDRHAMHVTRTRHGSRFTVGGGSSVFGAISFGGRSRSVTRSIETATLELRYRHPSLAPIRTAIIGFDTDRRAADDLRIALLDLAAPPTPPSAPQGSFLN